MKTLPQANNFFARATTFSTVKPNFSAITL
jgi:hypothetical protein